jgi:hypothetical protein
VSQGLVIRLKSLWAFGIGQELVKNGLVPKCRFGYWVAYLTSNEKLKSYDNIHSQKKGKMGKKINSPH